MANYDLNFQRLVEEVWQLNDETDDLGFADRIDNCLMQLETMTQATFKDEYTFMNDYLSVMHDRVIELKTLWKHHWEHHRQLTRRG